MSVIAQAAARRRPARSRFTFDRLEVLGPLFILPAILYVVVLVGLPFLLALYYSVSAYSIFNPSYTFVGLKNFREVIDSEIFRRTLANTLIFTISSQIIGLLLGKIGAMLLMQEFPGRRLARALIVCHWRRWPGCGCSTRSTASSTGRWSRQD
jgi:multiple sugar transport system permease protein